MQTQDYEQNYKVTKKYAYQIVSEEYAARYPGVNYFFFHTYKPEEKDVKTYDRLDEEITKHSKDTHFIYCAFRSLEHKTKYNADYNEVLHSLKDNNVHPFCEKKLITGGTGYRYNYYKIIDDVLKHANDQLKKDYPGIDTDINSIPDEEWDKSSRGGAIKLMEPSEHIDVTVKELQKRKLENSVYQYAKRLNATDNY